MPLPDIIIFADNHIVVAADVTLNAYTFQACVKGPAILCNIAMQNETNVSSWEVVVRRQTGLYTQSITLVPRVSQTSNLRDVVFTGRISIPKNFLLEVTAVALTLGDSLKLHGGVYVAD